MDSEVIPYSYRMDARMNPSKRRDPSFELSLMKERARAEERNRSEREGAEHASREMGAAMGSDYDEEGFGTY